MFNLGSKKFLALGLVVATLGIGTQVIRASTQDTLRFSFVATATSDHGISVLVGDRFTADLTLDLNSLSTSSSGPALYKFDNAVSQFTLTAHPSNAGSWSPSGVTWELNPAFNVDANANGDWMTLQIKSLNAPSINGDPFFDMQLTFGGDPRAFNAQEHTGTISLEQWLGTKNPDFSFASFEFQLRQDDQFTYESATFDVSQVVNHSTTTTTALTPAAPAATAPTTVGYQAGNKKVTVWWNSDSWADSYVVTNSRGEQICSTTDLSCDITQLKNGKSYTYNVYSVNQDGIRSTTATPVKVWSGFQVRMTTLKKNKSYSAFAIASGLTKRVVTWKSISGSCRLKGLRFVASPKKGTCKVRLSVKAKGKSPAMQMTLTLTVR
ncbi:MAG: hypothetical protein RIR69_1322 [Actinomycetota bacterium]|jgi:hypothetical protein